MIIFFKSDYIIYYLIFMKFSTLKAEINMVSSYNFISLLLTYDLNTRLNFIHQILLYNLKKNCESEIFKS